MALFDLLRAADVGDITPERPLSDLMRWRIGGPADIFVEPKSAEQVVRLMAIMCDRREPLLVMGDGSNLLMDSRGYSGVVMRIGRNLASFRSEGNKVTCGAGIWVPVLALRLSRLGLSGLEHVVGIPGTLGGLVVMNGGSQRKCVGAHVRKVSVVMPDGRMRELSQEELKFAYRYSALQGTGAVVTEVELELEHRQSKLIQSEMISILASRRKKFPKRLPNCGSTFLSDPSMYKVVGPPGRAIEEVGLKGAAIGGAQVSPLHANFIVNRGNATSDEVLALIAHIRATVLEHTGFAMDCEARFVSADGQEFPAHVFTDAGQYPEHLLHEIEFP